MKNTLQYTLIAIIFGMMMGKFIFNQYEQDAIKTIKNKNQYVYLMQYGVYKDENNMKESTKNIKNFFFYLDEKGYHVLIGITKNKKNRQKIVDSYGLLTNIYMKRVKINNDEFMQLLNQYDSLINETTDKDIIVNAQKQILSKYEELIIGNE